MCVVKYKFTSKTGGFESYDSHQLLCGGMVEVNSEPFRIAWFSRQEILQQTDLLACEYSHFSSIVVETVVAERNEER